MPYERPIKRRTLRQIRAEQGFLQKTIAYRLGLMPADISKLENRQNLTLGSLNRLVRAMGGRMHIIVEVGTDSYSLVTSEETNRSQRGGK
jgi:transcriptional regulator with XRE-family HTH domain